MRYALHPLSVEHVPEEVLRQIWAKAEPNLEETWYDGTVQNFEQFVQYLGTKLPFFLRDSEREEWVFAVFVEPLQNRWVWAHFIGLAPYRRGMGESTIHQLKTLGFRGLMGITPVSNEKAARLLKILSWKRVGAIPDFCNMVYKDKTEAGILSHYRFKE